MTGIILKGPSREKIFDALRLCAEIRSVEIVCQHIELGPIVTKRISVKGIKFTKQTGEDWIIDGWVNDGDGLNCRFEYNTQTCTGKFLPLFE
jgi:hypothetical protein